MYSRKNKIRNYVVFAAIGVAIGAGVIGYPKLSAYIQRVQIEYENETTMNEILDQNIIDMTIQNIQSLEEEKEEIIILENAYLDVPFICQAPFQTEANWVYHEESCEEAALLQVKYYLDRVTEVDKQVAHDTILDMINWQEENFGEHKDLYTNDMVSFIKGYYELEDEQIEVIYDAEILDIKKAISAGHPIIAPITGNILQNPYYPEPGYHMLTIIGYTPDKIITNDVGTRHGEDFSYGYEIFMKALKDAGGDIILLKEAENDIIS